MKLISTIIFFFSIFLSTDSYNTQKPNFCVNCKHFIPEKSFLFNDDKIRFSKCALTKFLVEKYDKTKYNYLVSGKGNQSYIDYYYCSTSRSSENMCGQEGKFYEKKDDE